MKALADFNTMYLLAKNYERINCITASGDHDDDTIIVSNVPSSLIDCFVNKINELIVREASHAYAQLEQAAENYAKAAMK